MIYQNVKRQRDGTCIRAAAARVLKEAGIQTLGAYIEKRQAAVAEWVDLRLVLEICDKETGYEGGGGRRKLCLRKTAARKHLSATLEDILAAARERRWESGRCGEVRGGREVSKSDAGLYGPWYYGMEIGDAWVG